jgi:phage FluMu protein Com
VEQDRTDFRCSKCDKLLFKGGFYFGVLEIKCNRCNSIEFYNTLSKIQNKEDTLFFLLDKNYCMEKIGPNVHKRFGNGIVGKSFPETFLDEQDKMVYYKNWEQKQPFFLLHTLRLNGEEVRARGPYIPQAKDGEFLGYIVIYWIQK